MNELTEIGNKSYGLKRINSKFWLIVSRNPFIPSSLRIRMLRLGGLKIGRNCFVGTNVGFDNMYPELIEIGDGCTITSGVQIISHFVNPAKGRYFCGKVKIGNGVFIGMNTLIINAVNIGHDAIIGAGSVVNKDIPAAEIWGGNPAGFIKKR